MRLEAINPRRLAKNAVVSLALSAVILVIMRTYASAYPVQDTLFLTGMLFAMLMLFRVCAATGFYDLFSYGYKSVMTSLKSVPEDKKRETFFEYTRNKERKIKCEPAIIAAAYLAVSLAIRIFM